MSTIVDKAGRRLQLGDYVRCSPDNIAEVIGRVTEAFLGADSRPRVSVAFVAIDPGASSCISGCSVEARLCERIGIAGEIDILEPQDPANKSPAEATAEKGYAHPGSVLRVPLGGELHLQYGHPGEVGRNGCYTSDILQALIDHIRVFQAPGHPMANRHSALVLTKLEEALLWDRARSTDRQARGVFQTDRA